MSRKYLKKHDIDLSSQVIRDAMVTIQDQLLDSSTDWLPICYDNRSNLYSTWISAALVPDKPRLSRQRPQKSGTDCEHITLTIRRRHLLTGIVPLSSETISLFPDRPSLALLRFINMQTGIEHEVWLDNDQGVLFGLASLFTSHLVQYGSQLHTRAIRSLNTYEFEISGVDDEILAHDRRERDADAASSQLVVSTDVPVRDTPDIELLPVLKNRADRLSRRIDALGQRLDTALDSGTTPRVHVLHKSAWGE